MPLRIIERGDGSAASGEMQDQAAGGRAAGNNTRVVSGMFHGSSDLTMDVIGCLPDNTQQVRILCYSSFLNLYISQSLHSEKKKVSLVRIDLDLAPLVPDPFLGHNDPEYASKMAKKGCQTDAESGFKFPKLTIVLVSLNWKLVNRKRLRTDFAVHPKPAIYGKT